MTDEKSLKTKVSSKVVASVPDAIVDDVVVVVPVVKKQRQVKKKVEEKVVVVESDCEEVKKNEKSFLKDGKLKGVWKKIDKDIRINRDVLPLINDKVNTMIDCHIKKLKVVDGKIDVPYLHPDLNSDKGFLITSTFNKYMDGEIKRAHGVQKVDKKVIAAIQKLIESELLTIFNYSQRVMKNAARKTLYDKDVELTCSHPSMMV